MTSSTLLAVILRPIVVLALFVAARYGMVKLRSVFPEGSLKRILFKEFEIVKRYD